MADGPRPAVLSIDVRRENNEQTLKLRQLVPWPTRPLAYIRMPEDDHTHHFGALFLVKTHRLLPSPLSWSLYQVQIAMAVNLLGEQLPHTHVYLLSEVPAYRNWNSAHCTTLLPQCGARCQCLVV